MAPRAPQHRASPSDTSGSRRSYAAGSLTPPVGVTATQLRAMLELARWAPSGDNCQPWRVRLSPDRRALDVILDPHAERAFLDVQGEATQLALGAFVESLMLAAARQRLGSELLPAPELSTVAARLAFAPAPDGVIDPLAEFLEARVSNRRLYTASPCSATELAPLHEAITGIDGTNVCFFTESRALRTVADAVALADGVRMRHRLCHDEFHQKVRWTEQQARREPTGFTVRTFEVRPHEALLLRLTRRYRVLRWVDRLTGMSRVAARVARRQVLASGAVGMLTVAGRDPQQLLHAGRALQRVWLAATQAGLAFQVLAVAPLLLRRCQLGGEGLRADEQKVIGHLRAKLAALPQAPPPESVAVMLRVGRAPAPTARTRRLPAEALVTTDSDSPAGVDDGPSV